MISHSKNVIVHIVLVHLVSFGFISMVTGGTCWADRMEGGKCKQPLQRQVSKEDCCAAGPDVGFTEKDMNDYEFFFATALGDGTSCSSCIDSCKTAKCGTGKRCAIRNGQPKCICSPMCKAGHKKRDNVPFAMAPSQRNDNTHQRKLKRNNENGRVFVLNYDSWSDAQNRSALEKRDVRHRHHARKRLINWGGKSDGAVEFNQRKNSSSPYYNPVCGTDGRTYKTECQMKKRACRQEISNLTVAYRGHCRTSCKNVICATRMHCLEDQHMMPHCVNCSLACPPHEKSVKSVVANPSKQVCGTDGITYRNLCEIKKTACLLGRAIPVAYRGACNDAASCSNIHCKDRQTCLSDLITHRPRCVSCSFKCPRRKQPQAHRNRPTRVCGRNEVSYNSWCHMVKDSCRTQLFIDIKHNGDCQAMRKDAKDVNRATTDRVDKVTVA